MLHVMLRGLKFQLPEGGVRMHIMWNFSTQELGLCLSLCHRNRSFGASIGFAMFSLPTVLPTL